jgi:hypothetical protein
MEAASGLLPTSWFPHTHSRGMLGCRPAPPRHADWKARNSAYRGVWGGSGVVVVVVVGVVVVVVVEIEILHYIIFIHSFIQLIYSNNI